MRLAAFLIPVALIVWGFALMISQIGKPRKPIEAPAAVISLFVNAGFIALVWYLWST